MIQAESSESQACTAARTTFEEAHANLRRWNKPVLVLGWATTILSILLLVAVGFIVLVPDLASGVTAAVAAGGTLVSGSLFVFVVKQRNGARADVKEQLAQVSRHCSVRQTVAGIDAI